MTKDYLKYEDVLLGKVTLPDGKTFLSSVDALNRMYPCHNCVGFGPLWQRFNLGPLWQRFNLGPFWQRFNLPTPP